MYFSRVRPESVFYPGSDPDFSYWSEMYDYYSFCLELKCFNGHVVIVPRTTTNLISRNAKLRNSCYMITVCPKGSNPFYIVSLYIKLIITTWTYIIRAKDQLNCSDLFREAAKKDFFRCR